MKTINLRGITESMSEREMKLVKGGLDQPMVYLDNQLGGGNATACDKITPCKDKTYKASCSYTCNGQSLTGRCCDSGGFTAMHCSDLGDFAC